MNQKGVGAALKGLPRDSFFITSKVPPGEFGDSLAAVERILKELQTDSQASQIDGVSRVTGHFFEFRGVGVGVS